MAESQQGQLLYYLLAVQLDKLQRFWSPLRRNAAPVLGLFMEEGMVGYVTKSFPLADLTASVVNRQKSLWCVELSVGHKQYITDGGLVTALTAAHAFMSAEYTP